MGTVVVRYRPKANRADENQDLVEAVFAELGSVDPGGVRYATLRLADGTFIHIADIEADPNPLGNIAAFARFQEGIVERCEPGEGPNPQAATVVGSYRFFAESSSS
ncbi:MAG: hypothetical protein V3U46_11605 [Acidimicrobiia bacterium]|jgi:hypothetical protein